jgi:hypothetical protein
MLKSPQARQAGSDSLPGSGACGWFDSPVSGAIEFDLRRLIHQLPFLRKLSGVGGKSYCDLPKN